MYAYDTEIVSSIMFFAICFVYVASVHVRIFERIY